MSHNPLPERSGLVDAIKNSHHDVVVHPVEHPYEAVIIKAGGDVLVSDRAEAQTLARELADKLDMEAERFR